MEVGRVFLAYENVILDNCYSWQCSKQIAKIESRGAGSQRISSPAKRARPLLIVSSKVAYIDGADELGSRSMAVSRKVVAQKGNCGPAPAYRRTWRN